VAAGHSSCSCSPSHSKWVAMTLRLVLCLDSAVRNRQWRVESGLDRDFRSEKQGQREIAGGRALGWVHHGYVSLPRPPPCFCCAVPNPSPCGGWYVYSRRPAPPPPCSQAARPVHIDAVSMGRRTEPDQTGAWCCAAPDHAWQYVHACIWEC
jgi:hypothetical protein